MKHSNFYFHRFANLRKKSYFGHTFHLDQKQFDGGWDRVKALKRDFSIVSVFVHFQRSEIKMANWTKSLMINLLLYSIHIHIHSSICWTSQPAATLSFVSFNFNQKTSPPILILDKTSMNEVEKNLIWRIFWTIIIVLILWKWLFLVLSTQAVLLTSFFLPVALPRFIRHLFQDNFKKRVFKKK